MRAPTVTKRFACLILAITLFTYSLIAPIKARAEVVTAGVIAAAVVTGAAAGTAYISLTEFCNAEGITSNEGKALTALVQLLCASQGSYNPALATSISNFTAQQTVLDGLRNAGGNALSTFQNIANNAIEGFGQMWFDFSHMSNFYISDLTGDVSGNGLVGGSVTYYGTEEEVNSLRARLSFGIVSEYWASRGITIGGIMGGAYGDTGIYYNTNGTQPAVTIYGNCAIHNVKIQMHVQMQTDGTLVIDEYHLSTVHAPAQTSNISTFENNLTVQQGQYVDTTNPNQQPTKIVVPPPWVLGQITSDTTVGEDQTTGAGATTDSTGADSVTTGLDSIYGSIKNLPDSIARALSSLFTGLADFFKPYLSEITGNLEDVKSKLETFPAHIADLKSSIETLPQSISNALGLEQLPQILNDIKDSLTTFPQSITNAIQDSLETFPQALENVKSTIIEWGDIISANIENLSSYVSGLGGVIGDAITTAWGNTWYWLQTALDAITGAITGIYEWTTTLTATITGILTDVFVPTFDLTLEAETTADNLKTRFPFGFDNWFSFDYSAPSASWQKLLVFYDGRFGRLEKQFDFIANKDKYDDIKSIATFFIYGLGVVAAYRMLKPKVSI